MKGRVFAGPATVACCALVVQAAIAGAADESAADLSWLEDADGKRALEWVRTQNERTLDRLTTDERYAAAHQTALAIRSDKNQIPGATGFDGWLHNGWIYNVWQDAVHVRGLWRRAPIESFVAGQPQWDVLLDIDELARQEKRNWLLPSANAECLGPDDARCMIRLSDGGRLQTEPAREFNTRGRRFVDDGFMLPMRSAAISWKDADTLLITPYEDDMGRDRDRPPARQVVVEWSRGQPFEKAQVIYTGHPGTLAVAPQEHLDENGKRLFTFGEMDWDRRWTYWTLSGDGAPQRLTLPRTATLLGLHRGELIFMLWGQAWTLAGKTWKAGSLLSIPAAELTSPHPAVRLLLEPGLRDSDISAGIARGAVFATFMSDVRARIVRLHFEDGRWKSSPVPLPGNGTARLAMYDPQSSTAFAVYEDYLQPPTLYAIPAVGSRLDPIFSQPPQFNSRGFVAEQLEALSRDGTRVPYFVVRARSARANGKNPTLMHGYGAFGLSTFPQYLGVIGPLWLERGGIYVDTVIRGGGEFGSAWHEEGRKFNKVRAYEDFRAIARDLFRRGITSPRRLGIDGLSAGGLLAGVMITQTPELFHAALVRVPVLDLLRLDLIGSHEMANEFGSPDIPQERAFLERISPFQNLRRRADFPIPFIITSTHDDNVRPGQPRRFAARMQALGMPFLYYEAPEGGHAESLDPVSRARLDALKFTYLTQQLID